MSSALGTFALGLGGVLVGAALVTVLRREDPPAARKEPPREASTPVGAGGPQSDVIMQALRAQAQASIASAPVDAGVAPVAAHLDPQDLQRAEADLRVGKLADHQGELRDAQWAPTMEKNLRSDLAALGDKERFNTLSVECRSTSCLAELEYSSYAQAFASRIDLVTHRFSTKCAREAFTPKPDDPTAPFRAELLFECDEQASAE